MNNKLKSVRGGILVQDFNDKLADEYERVTEKKVDESQQEILSLG